ncbi:MAG: DUF4160 domain-containing protein [Cyanobacteria bacterium P01_F01_bin.143]
MVKVENFHLHGLEAFFRSSDHYPPHFHVKKKGYWEIRVYIITSTSKLHYSVKFPKNNKQLPSSKEEKLIVDFVRENREKLYIEWEAKVCVKEKMADD